MLTGNEPAMPVRGANNVPYSFKSEMDRKWFEQTEPTIGLTKREHFAAMAMQGLLSNSPDWDKNEIGLNWVSQASTKYADALIAELNK